MDKGYIAPESALRKLRAANGMGQTVYIYGATGYGKTELVKQYLSKRRYRYISSAEDAAGLLDVAAQGDRKGKGAETRTVVAVDFSGCSGKGNLKSTLLYTAGAG